MELVFMTNVDLLYSMYYFILFISIKLYSKFLFNLIIFCFFQYWNENKTGIVSINDILYLIHR